MIGALGEVRVTLEPLRDGMRGTADTVRRMRAKAYAASLNPHVRRIAEIVCHEAGVTGGDREGEARALFDFMREHVEYRRDPAWSQMLIDPLTILERVDRRGWAAANCAGHAMTMAALGQSIRLPMWWMLAGDAPGDFGHVYACMARRDPPSRDDFLALDSGVPYGSAVFGLHAELPVREAVSALPKELR